MDTSYLAQQVTTIIGQLHGLFDEIGVPTHERDSRESEVSTLVTMNQTKTIANMTSALRRPFRNTTQPAQSGRKRKT